MTDTTQQPPTPGVPAWHPDPTGRHQLRWWDGNAFTDQVADGGTTATDPGHGPTPQPTPQPTAQPAAHVPFNPALPADVRGKKASRLPIILAALGAFVVVLGVLTLTGDDDGGGGTGDFEGTVTSDEPGRHEVSIPGGSVVVVNVEPDDFDVVVAFELDNDDAEVIADLYEGTPFEGQADNNDEVFRRDVGFEGDDEVTFLAVTDDVDATVVVTGFDDAEGDYQISIEAFELDLPDDPDGGDVLDAVVEADGVPSSVTDQIESLLGD